VTGGNAENHYKPSDLTTDLTTSPKSLGPSLKSSKQASIPHKTNDEKEKLKIRKDKK